MRIGILLYPQCSTWSASAPMEMFYWAYRVQSFHKNEKNINKKFEVSYVSSVGKSDLGMFDSFNVKVEAINKHDSFDLIIVPGFSSNAHLMLSKAKESIDWIVDQYTKGVTIVSYCSGSFLLAQSGILKNRTATTHWLLKQTFENTFPEIPLDLSKVIIDYGDVMLGGSATSYQNVILLIIERYMGRTVAIGVSKIYLINLTKDRPDSYMNLAFEKQHNDDKISKAQEFIKSNFNRIVSLDEISENIALNKRTFVRRFKNATNDTPLNYMNKLKVEKAKYILENELKTFEEIAFYLGYEDVSAFRKIFTKHTGISPMAYKLRYQLS